MVAVTASWFVGSFVVFFGRNTMSLRRCDGFVRRWFFDRRMTFGGSTVKGVTAAQFQNNGSLIFVVGGSHTFTGILSLSRIYLVRMGDHSIETIPIQSMRRCNWDFTVYVYIYISQWEPSFRSSGSRCCMCVNRGISRFNDGRSNHFQNVTSRKALDDSVVLINCIYCTENCGATPCLRQIFEYLKILFSSASKFWFDR